MLGCGGRKPGKILEFWEGTMESRFENNCRLAYENFLDCEARAEVADYATFSYLFERFCLSGKGADAVLVHDWEKISRTLPGLLWLRPDYA